jgi:hypothetical protein
LTDLAQLLESVTDEESFLTFVRALVDDRKRAAEMEREQPPSSFDVAASGWANSTIESYLSAAASWAEDSDFGERQGLAAATAWRRCATFLYCGKIYE